MAIGQSVHWVGKLPILYGQMAKETRGRRAACPGGDVSLFVVNHSGIDVVKTELDGSNSIATSSGLHATTNFFPPTAARQSFSNCRAICSSGPPTGSWSAWSITSKGAPATFRDFSFWIFVVQAAPIRFIKLRNFAVEKGGGTLRVVLSFRSDYSRHGERRSRARERVPSIHH